LNFISRELEDYFWAFIPSPETLIWHIKFHFFRQEKGLTGINMLWGFPRASSDQLPKLNKLD